MKKTILSLFLLFAVCENPAANQAYYFYNYKEIITLNQVNSYLAIKFKEGVGSNTKESILREFLNNLIESKSEMITGSAGGKKFHTTICKLKSEAEINALSEAKNKLSADNNIEYVGSGFVKNDRVVHIATNEIIVKFKKNISSFDIDNLNRLFKTEIIENVSGFDNLYLIKISPESNAFDAADKYALTSFVEFAQPNFIRIGMLASPPNDSLLPDMWNIKNTGNNNPFNIQTVPGCDLNVIPAWEQTIGSSKVLLAIIDTGVDTNHIDLKESLVDDRNLWYDAYDEDHQPYDLFSHGTAITGIAGAVGNNSIGTVGVAFGCKIMPVRAFGPWPEAATTDLILAKALNWAWLHGADVLSNSWGGGIPTPVITHAILNAKEFGRNGKGAVVFAASGNDDNDTVLYPATMPEVICVGGLSPCNQRKSLTSCDNFNNQQGWGANYGENLSIVAPTPFIGTTLLLGGWCICANGTSSSCPQAAAIGALILSKNINLSADSVKMIIERSAQKIGNYSYNIQKPNGMWNNEMGYGRIDAKFALDMTPPGPSQIYDQVPPVIDPIIPQSGRYNSGVSFTAKITDNQLVANWSNAPRMYFRTSRFPDVYSVNGVQGSNNNYTFSFPAVSYGTKIYFYLAAQDTSSNYNIATYPYGGKGVNPPGSISPRRNLFLQNTDVYDTVFFSTNVPLTINGSAETTVVSILNNDVNKTVLGISPAINITHTYLAELSISIISPSGTETALVSGVGNDGDNFTNTVFDDYAPTSIDDTANKPPYTGIFKPLEKLWLLNGEPSFGEWKLKIVDNGGGDGGVLNGWSISFKYSTDKDDNIVPRKFALLNNYPNPFNPITRIAFSVPYRARIKIIIYDLLGREVIKLLDEFRNPALEDYVDFNVNDSRVNGGKSISSGVYFCSLVVDDNFIDSRKILLVK
jgi:subtilisin-like proprotein convertase family protein